MFLQCFLHTADAPVLTCHLNKPYCVILCCVVLELVLAVFPFTGRARLHDVVHLGNLAKWNGYYPANLNTLKTLLMLPA